MSLELIVGTLFPNSLPGIKLDLSHWKLNTFEEFRWIYTIITFTNKVIMLLWYFTYSFWRNLFDWTNIYSFFRKKWIFIFLPWIFRIYIITIEFLICITDLYLLIITSFILITFFIFLFISLWSSWRRWLRLWAADSLSWFFAHNLGNNCYD